MLPREKFLEKGLMGLSDKDLISVIIGSGSKGISFHKISANVISVLKTGEFSMEKFVEIKGLGKIKALKILCSLELGRRFYQKDFEKKIISNSSEAFQEVQYLVTKRKEYLVGLFLNARYQLIDKRVISMGTVDKLNVIPRDILCIALKCNATSFILVHNHPSGNPEPSSEDQEVTNLVLKASKILGVKMLDHLVVATQGWRSIC